MDLYLSATAICTCSALLRYYKLTTPTTNAYCAACHFKKVMSLTLSHVMNTANSLNKAADRGASAVKHLTLKLKANWSNLDAWLMKARNNAKGPRPC